MILKRSAFKKPNCILKNKYTHPNIILQIPEVAIPPMNKGLTPTFGNCKIQSKFLFYFFLRQLRSYNTYDFTKDRRRYKYHKSVKTKHEASKGFGHAFIGGFARVKRRHDGHRAIARKLHGRQHRKADFLSCREFAFAFIFPAQKKYKLFTHLNDWLFVYSFE